MICNRNMIVIIAIMLVAFIGGCAENTSTTTVAPSEPAKNEQPQVATTSPNVAIATVNQENNMSVTVYNATPDAMYLVAEHYSVTKNDHPAQTAVELLLAGTKNSELVSVVPMGTKLRQITIKNKVAYVDFSDHLVKNSTGGAASEVLLVAAIVNTLTEFHNIQKVQILVEGKNIEAIGDFDISEPLSRSEKIIKK